MTWHRIDDKEHPAPRDGTPVLVYGQWAGEINGPDGESGILIASWNGGRTDHPGYDWDVMGGDAYASWVKPTHWMPLPVPPQTEDGK